jgi:hypothetical protein
MGQKVVSCQGREMHPFSHAKFLPKLFLALTVAYFLLSLGHFSHNAKFICEYPNLPAWLTRAKVYAAWAAITSVGVLGFYLIRKRLIAAGLLFVAVYAALGFDGLGHYAVAPIELHTFMANLTILSEVAAAALLLPVTLYLLTLQLLHGETHARPRRPTGWPSGVAAGFPARCARRRMPVKIRDYTPLLRAAITEARAAGFETAANDLEKATLAAYTTSSEMLQEHGLAIRRFLHSAHDTLPRSTREKMNACLTETELASSGWRKLMALVRRRHALG